MKKAYSNPELVVIALDAEDIVTASKPATTTPGGTTGGGIGGTTDIITTPIPDVPTTEPTTELDLDQDLWVPTVTDGWD